MPDIQAMNTVFQDGEIVGFGWLPVMALCISISGFIIFFVEPALKKQVEEALGALEGYVLPFLFTDGGAHGWKIYESESE